jgi:hypothetical protein
MVRQTLARFGQPRGTGEYRVTVGFRCTAQERSRYERDAVRHGYRTMSDYIRARLNDGDENEEARDECAN